MRQIIALILLGFAPLAGWSQGTIIFQNGGLTFSPVQNRYVYAYGPIGGGDASDAARRLVGTNYCAGLWYVQGAGNGGQFLNGHGGALALNGIPTSVSLFTFRPSTTSDANRGTWLPVGGNAFVLAGVDVGQSATLQVRVWDWLTYGRSEAGYQAALSAGSVAWSEPFDYTVPAAGSTPDKYYMNGFKAFIVPEPSTVALGMLGAEGLLLCRRRNVR